MEGTFTQGFLAGILLAGILGFLLGRMRLAFKRVGSPARPQSIVNTTKKSPFQVMGDGLKAVFSVLVYAFLLILVLYAVISTVS